MNVEPQAVPNGDVGSQQLDEQEFAKLGLMERIEKLKDAMLRQDPLLGTHLGAIHKTLLQFEELIHIIPQDEVIPVLVAAQKKLVGVKLVEEVSKKKSVRAPKTTVDDL